MPSYPIETALSLPELGYRVAAVQLDNRRRGAAASQREAPRQVNAGDDAKYRQLVELVRQRARKAVRRGR